MYNEVEIRINTLKGSNMDKQREIYKEDFTEYLLCLALDVGEGMLKNGAEVGRVEDTIERICRAYGAAHVEVFTIISVINAAVRMPDGSYSMQLRRVKSIDSNFSILEKLNALSRKICVEKPELSVFDDEIHKIKSEKAYPTWVPFVASSVAAGGFALFFGGNIFDAIVALIIGAIIALIENFSPKRLTGLAKTVVSSLVAAILAGLSVRLGIGANDDMIMMGTIMLLVPGIAFGTAMRDLLCGDLIAGTLKTLQAILSALMIAFGYTLAVFLLGGATL